MKCQCTVAWMLADGVYSRYAELLRTVINMDLWWCLKFVYLSTLGIFGTEQRGVCTDDGDLLFLCHSCHQKPSHLHAILNPQGAQDGQLPKPSGKDFHALAIWVDDLDLTLPIHLKIRCCVYCVAQVHLLLPSFRHLTGEVLFLLSVPRQLCRQSMHCMEEGWEAWLFLQMLVAWEEERPRALFSES